MGLRPADRSGGTSDGRAGGPDGAGPRGGNTAVTTSFVPQGVKVLSVSELTNHLKGVVEEAFPAVWVSGEVSNLKKHTSGHWYLSLRDAGSQLDTVIYRGVNLRLRYDLRDGMKVIAYGRLMI